MRVLIVAKTRRGGGACVGGLTEDGRSVRLIAPDAATNDRAGLEYAVGEVWDVEFTPDPQIVPPHVENVTVRRARRLRQGVRVEPVIERYLPPVTGGPDLLFDGRLQATSAGALYVAEQTGLPGRSTMFWVPDQALQLDTGGKRIRFCYPTPDGGRTLTFVGFQEPIEALPAGTLVRVSLAHWWRPKEHPAEELRCYVQLSGWFLRSRAPATPGVDPAPPEPVEHRAALVSAGMAGGDFGRARAVLKRTFGYADFLPRQAEVIRHVLQGGDALVVMPTGGGKSLCYQLPALLREGLTVVVSPLIALMQDQVDQLRQLGVPAAFLNSTLTHREYVGIARRVRANGLQLLYLAPETLLRPETLRLLSESQLVCLAVDEAHCISEWGHDFRTEYRQLAEVRRRFPQATCLALTATATPRVREDVRQLLGIDTTGEFVASFDRPNLFLRVQPRRDGLAQTLAFLESRRDQAGIVYCSTRQRVDDLAAALNANGRPALPYHAGLEDAARRQHQERFLCDEVPLMVATVAFGMGINKSNVRFVVHFNLPKDPESYYQEIGRAGRDGLPADCLLLYSRADAVTVRHFIDQGAASERGGRQARLNALLRYAETRTCRRIPLLAYFGEDHPGACGHCDNCCAVPATGATADATLAARKFLACVVRMGERFGVAHTVAVLRGSRAERVVALGQDRLDVHGTGREYSNDQWRELVRHFLDLGLLEQDLAYGSLRLTTHGRQTLAGKGKPVHVPLSQPATGRPAATPPARTAPEADLFQRLRGLRRELAQAAGVPAYVVFSDRALIEMAQQQPRDAEQLLAIYGVGEVKLERYGARFLALIRAYQAGESEGGKPSATV